MKHSRILAVGASAAATLTLLTVSLTATPVLAKSGAHGKGGTPVEVRVEGLAKTLLPETLVGTKAASIVKDGKPADVCSGDTAAVALQDATKGSWVAGTFSSGLGYPVTAILGESYPFTSNYYWSFWIDNKPATTGICGATLHPGDKVLFFPQCSQESASACPQGMFDPAVLEIKAAAKAKVGKAVAMSVSALANFTGKPSPGAGVKLAAAGKTVTTDASGKAKLKFAKAGSYKIVASAANSVRDELTVKVSR
ncbi:MAG TPA: DUF4430 domain-containing protein [Solirubrobacteraceae bacterium]|nr:DUF4430 domain-containing protein [Solirubrobacteraceae bacterium]